MDKKRHEYFEELAENFGISVEDVEMLADLLGPSEDYDGLPAMLDDYFG